MSFFIQANYGVVGNFEVVSDSPNDRYRGLIHRWRNNDASGLPWNFAGHFFRTRFTCRRPALIQEQRTRKLHVVAIVSDGAATRLGHFVRENNPTWGWADPDALPSSEGLTYSGNPVLAQDGSTLEVAVPLDAGGIARWRWSAGTWTHLGVFQRSLGRIGALALVISRSGRYELLIRRGNSLEHLTRAAAAGDDTWSTPRRIYDGAVGTPGFIQGRFGTNGNFEIVTANLAGGLTFIWCNNDDAASPIWSPAFDIASHFGDPGARPADDDAVGLVQSNFGAFGNLEVLARRNGRTDFFWRIDRPPWTWTGPSHIATDPPDASALLRRAGTLERRLDGCQDLRNSIVWETGAGVRVPYDDWTRPHKDRLNELFQRIKDGEAVLGVRCPDVRANMPLRYDPGSRHLMLLTADEAFDIYAAHVAHAFHLETSGAVNWSLLDLPALELAELLSSDRYHSRIVVTALAGATPPYYPSHIVPGRDFQLIYQGFADQCGISCDPRAGYDFLRGARSTSRENKIGASEQETLANLTMWFLGNVGHGGWPHDGPFDNYIRRSDLRDRLRTEERDFGFATYNVVWASAGCHSAANLLHDLARSVNIPLLVGRMFEAGTSHSGVAFRFQRAGTRVLQHADDIYAGQLAPFFPVFGDGARIPPSDVPRLAFEASWTPYEELRRQGYAHSTSYDLDGSTRSWDLPHLSAHLGDWPSSAVLMTHKSDKAYLLGSWVHFVYYECASLLTDEGFARLGLTPPRPIAELQLRARQVLDAYGGCSALGAANTAWPATRGTDSWTDT